MSQQYQAAANILKGAITAINGILNHPDDELHRLKLSRALQREVDYLLLVTGAGDLTESNSTVLGPAKTIGGKAIGKLPKITDRDLKPSDDAVLNLKDQVENALFYFGPKSNSAGILANIPDIVVRGVAKKAGLTVTKDNPKELTVEFIEQIKEALLVKGLVAVPEQVEVELAEELSEAVKNVAATLTVDDPLLETQTDPVPEATKEFLDETNANRPEPKTDQKKKQTGK